MLTAGAMAAIGAAIEMSLPRRLYRAPELLQLLATFGVVQALSAQMYSDSAWDWGAWGPWAPDYSGFGPGGGW
jgi:branched-chain amino acid transport system permease protein